MNFLKNILILIIFTQSKSMVLDCKYSNGLWVTLGLVYQCEASVSLIVNSDKIKVINVSGNHEQGKTNPDVELLHIRFQNLQSFPKEIDKFFMNLKGIYALDNRIETITKNDLKVFPNLEYFDFHGNDITVIDDDLFEFTPNLKFVSFSANKVKHIGLNTFKALSNLKILYLYGENNCLNNGKAETHDEVESLISKLPNFCPPNNEMIIKEIWKLQGKNEARFESLETKFDSLKRQIEYLVTKIENIH